jgi:hypothetical protein
MIEKNAEIMKKDKNIVEKIIKECSQILYEKINPYQIYELYTKKIIEV